jgi:hypothetical protein
MTRRIAALCTAALLVLAACDDEPLYSPPASTPPSTTPVSPSVSVAPTVPDATTVEVATLLRPGATAEAALYGDLNRVAPSEIVVLSSIPSGDPELPPVPYLDAFSWDPAPAEWVKVFDATSYQDASTGRGPLLAATDVVSQEVPFLQIIDFAEDGAPELVVGVQSYGASAGPLDVWILSWLSEAFATEFLRSTERGGQMAFRESTVTLETGVYRPGDPGCCPSAIETLLIGWDAGSERIVVLERTEREVEQG